MKKYLLALVLCGISAAPVAAHADSIYNLTLTNTTGNVSGGTGILTLDANPNPSNAWQIFTQNGSPGYDLKGLTFTIGGDTLNLGNSPGGTDAVFANGSLTSLDYTGYNSSFTIFLGSNGLGYTFFDAITGKNSIGTISAISPNSTLTSAVPEPSSLALFGSGIVGLAGLVRRRLVS